MAQTKTKFRASLSGGDVRRLSRGQWLLFSRSRHLPVPHDVVSLLAQTDSVVHIALEFQEGDHSISFSLALGLQV